MAKSIRKSANVFVFAGPSIIADVAGFAEFAEARRTLENAAANEFTLDLSSVSYVEAHMLAALKAIIRDSVLRGAEIKCHSANSALGEELISDPAQDAALTRARSFGLEDAVQFSQHAAELLRSMETLSVTREVERKVLEALNEVFANSAMHSGSQAGVTFGAAYHSGRNLLCFVVADTGKGIPGSVHDARLQFALDEVAIAWAMEPNNTTKPPNIPGGLGSVVLRTFVEANGGRLIVASRKGFWEQTGAYVRKFPLPHAYPGTVVVLEVVTTDSTAYDSGLDFDPNDMW